MTVNKFFIIIICYFVDWAWITILLLSRALVTFFYNWRPESDCTMSFAGVWSTKMHLVQVCLLFLLFKHILPISKVFQVFWWLHQKVKGTKKKKKSSAIRSNVLLGYIINRRANVLVLYIRQRLTSCPYSQRLPQFTIKRLKGVCFV